MYTDPIRCMVEDCQYQQVFVVPDGTDVVDIRMLVHDEHPSHPEQRIAPRRLT